DLALRRRGFEATADYVASVPDIAMYWSPAKPKVRVDVFIAGTAFEEAVIASAKRARYLDREVPIASPEALIVYKVLAGRHKDLQDLEWVFQARSDAGHELDWAFIDHWCREWEITQRLAPWRVRYGPK